MMSARYSNRNIHIQFQYTLALSYILCLLQPCGVDYELKAYIANEADNVDEKIVKKYAVLYFNIKILSEEMHIIRIAVSHDFS